MSIDTHALAGAMVLLHSDPPKSLLWRPGGMEKKDRKATEYCEKVDDLIRTQVPNIKGRRLRIWRNRVLRKIFENCGIERKNT